MKHTPVCIALCVKKVLLLIFSCFIFQITWSQWTTGTGGIYYNSGNVGIGMTTPVYPLDVNGQARVQVTSGTAFIVTSNGANIYTQVGAFSFNTNGNTYNSINNSASTAAQNELRFVRTNNGNYNLSAFGANYTATELALNTIGGIKWKTNGNVTGSFSEVEPSFYTWNGTYNEDVLRLFSNGNIGIGVGSINSGYKLDVKGTVRFSAAVQLSGLTSDNTQTKALVGDANGNLFYRDISTLGGTGSGWALTGNSAVNPSTTFLGTTDNTPVAFRVNNVEKMRIDPTTGNIGIGTTAPQSTLAVKGTITTTKIVVTPTGWADYVFEPSYQLPSLTQLERFIQVHKHLPEIPSASAVAKEGNDLGANQVALLKKIEELTLYIIDQQKQIDTLKSKVRATESLQSQINELKAMLQK